MFNSEQFTDAIEKSGNIGKNQPGVQDGFYFVNHDTTEGSGYAYTKLNFEKRSGSEVLYQKTATVWHPQSRAKYKNDEDFQKAVTEFGKYITQFAQTYVSKEDLAGINVKTPTKFVEEVMKRLPKDVSKTEVEVALIYKNKPFITDKGDRVYTTEIANKTYGFNKGKFMKKADEEGTIQWGKYVDKKMVKPDTDNKIAIGGSVNLDDTEINDDIEW